MAPGSRWDSRVAKFDLAGLDAATTAAVLRQWALAPHLRAEIVRAAASAEKFAARYGASVNHLRNMCNGHRLIDYSTLALVMTVAGSANAFDEVTVEKEMSAATTRSQPKATASPAGKTRTSSYVTLTDPELTGPRAREARIGMPVNHPDAELIATAFAAAVIADSKVVAYLNGAAAPAVEVSVFIAPSADDAGAEGFVTRDVLGATVWAPADWTTTVLERFGGIVDGRFVCAVCDDGEVRAAGVVVEAGENPTEWDLAIGDHGGWLEAGGNVQWF